MVRKTEMSKDKIETKRLLTKLFKKLIENSNWMLNDIIPLMITRKGIQK